MQGSIHQLKRARDVVASTIDRQSSRIHSSYSMAEDPLISDGVNARAPVPVMTSMRTCGADAVHCRGCALRLLDHCDGSSRVAVLPCHVPQLQAVQVVAW